MPWVEPRFTRGEVNRAGKAVIESNDPVTLASARETLKNWRSAHGFPLNGMTRTLNNRARKLAPRRPLIAQRLKRLVSIENKLLRRPHVRATQIQDLGGCRIILPTISEVRRMHLAYEQGRSHVFHLHRTDDYITRPKTSGYRSLHLVYRYDSSGSPQWRNMRVELQMRSRLQHAWATAVEAVAFFEGQDLKAGEGNERWLRFFTLAAHHIAMEEKCPGIVGVDEAYRDRLRQLWEDLDAYIKLVGWRQSLQIMRKPGKPNTSRFVLHLDTKARTIQVTSFAGGKRAVEDQSADLAGQLESDFAEDPNHHIVNVSVHYVNQLRRAYPGFFADTGVFCDAIERAVENV